MCKIFFYKMRPNVSNQGPLRKNLENCNCLHEVILQLFSCVHEVVLTFVVQPSTPSNVWDRIYVIL